MATAFVIYYSPFLDRATDVRTLISDSHLRTYDLRAYNVVRFRDKDFSALDLHSPYKTNSSILVKIHSEILSRCFCETEICPVFRKIFIYL